MVQLRKALWGKSRWPGTQKGEGLKHASNMCFLGVRCKENPCTQMVRCNEKYSQTMSNHLYSQICAEKRCEIVMFILGEQFVSSVPSSSRN